ncbi:MAG: C1 family peptidase [FCB group bacterium]|jgi:bleomycin hydrolase
MKNGIILIFALMVFFCLPTLNAQEQRKDKGEFVEPKNEFWDEIQKSADEFVKKKEPPAKAYKLDFSSYDLPKSTKEFTEFKHTPPVAQGWTGTCWCFSGTSFLESEIMRIYNKEIKISEMHTVYWEYVEKAKRYVKERGKSEFGEGSECNALIRIWKQYGCVPEDDYTGLKPEQKFHDHRSMVNEMDKYLKSLKNSNTWNEDIVVSTIKSILNHYLGAPPATVTVDGQKYTPKEYCENVVKLNLDDYVDLMSLMEKPYLQKVEYEVPDNWWKSDSYYNVPLDDFMNAIKKAVKKGYSMAIGGDVSEAGYESHVQVAMIPSFDIPSEYIDENAREFRFNNKSTTDDHGIHLVGYKEKDGKFWFLIKDSGSGSRNGTNKGYYFYQEDYIKLKMMSILIHRSAVEDLLKKFK